MDEVRVDTSQEARKVPLRLRRFLEGLGWDHVELNTERFTREGVRYVMSWFECPLQPGVHLQVNIDKRPTNYWACLLAHRYRIISGFHEVYLSTSHGQIDSEIERLSPLLHTSWMDTSRQRREFRNLHPEYANWTIKKKLKYGLPHLPW